jgi:hypothetical protein
MEWAANSRAHAFAKERAREGKLEQRREPRADYNCGATPYRVSGLVQFRLSRYFDNRKNSLFVGNPRGGRTAAILASLTSTCRRHEVDPQLYFTQLLMNLPPLLRQLPHQRRQELDAWLPDQWKQSQAARSAALA